MKRLSIFSGSLIALVAMAAAVAVQPAVAQVSSSDVVAGSLLTELKKRENIKVGFFDLHSVGDARLEG